MSDDLSPAERDELAAAVRSFLSSKAERDWRSVVELGWTGIGVPAELGGAGFGQRARTVLAGAAGEMLGGGGLLWPTLGLALPLAQSAGAGKLVGEIVAGRRASVGWDGPFAAAPQSPPLRAHDGRVTGRLVAVPGGADADVLLAPVGAEEFEIWALPSSSYAVRDTPAGYVDQSCPVSTVDVDGPGDRLLAGDEASRAWAAGGRLAALWLAAESVGIAGRLLESAVQHAREREQFGRKIGTFQAVSHPLADLYADVQLARSAVDWAAESADRSLPDAADATLAATMLAGDAAVVAAEQAMQVYGALGITWESSLHRYYKRALAIGAFDGGARGARRRLAASLFDRGR